MSTKTPRTRFKSTGLAVSLGAMVASYAGSASADPPCSFFKDLSQTQRNAYRTDAATNGGYVFAFRHSNKTNQTSPPNEGLTQSGKDAATAAHQELHFALNPPGAVDVWEMLYPPNKRVTQTRVAVMRGCDVDRLPCTARRNVTSFPRNQDFRPHIGSGHAAIGDKNIFVFANSSSMSAYGSAPQISCLEGIVYKADTVSGTGPFKCYRFFPAEWAAADPANATLPAWARKPSDTSVNPSAECH